MAPKATSEVAETINLDSSQASLSALPFFNPADPSTYSKVISRTVKDKGVEAVAEVRAKGAEGNNMIVSRARPAIPPADHELKQYFVKTGDNQWLMYTLIDGRNPLDHTTTTPLKSMIIKRPDGSLSLASSDRGMNVTLKNELSLNGWQPAEVNNGVWGPDVATGSMTIPLPLSDGNIKGLDKDDVILESGPSFDPGNPASYNKLFTRKITDSSGKEHDLQLYYVRTADKQWTLNTLIDGRHPMDPGSASPLETTMILDPNGLYLPDGGEHIKRTLDKEFMLSGWKPVHQVNGAWAASAAPNSGPIVLSLNDGAIEGVDDSDATVNRLVPSFNPSDVLTFNKSFVTPIYDSLGNKHELAQYFVKDDTNSWTAHILIDGRNPADPGRTDPVSVNMSFDAYGALASITGSDGLTVANKTATLKNWVPARVIDAGKVSERWIHNGAQGNSTGISMDLSKVSQHNALTSRNSPQQDGHAAGVLSSTRFDANGILSAGFTNGLYKKIGQVVLAGFANEQGLRPNSNTHWTETNDSGIANMDAPKVGTLGGIVSGALEGSNVELTDELVELVQAQVAYQASSKTLSTEVTLMQTLIQAT